MVDEQIVVERVGMIEIRNLPVVERQIFQIAVIRILLNENDFTGLDCFQDAVCYRRLARPVPPEMPMIKLINALLLPLLVASQSLVGAVE